MFNQIFLTYNQETILNLELKLGGFCSSHFITCLSCSVSSAILFSSSEAQNASWRSHRSYSAVVARKFRKSLDVLQAALITSTSEARTEN